jgi:hypothetical protein
MVDKNDVQFNPFTVINDLLELGSITVKASSSDIKQGRQVNETIFTEWVVMLETSHPIEKINEAFFFLEDKCEFVIQTADPTG